MFLEAEVAALKRVSTLPSTCKYAQRQCGVRSLCAEGEQHCAQLLMYIIQHNRVLVLNIGFSLVLQNS